MAYLSSSCPALKPAELKLGYFSCGFLFINLCADEFGYVLHIYIMLRNTDASENLPRSRKHRSVSGRAAVRNINSRLVIWRRYDKCGDDVSGTADCPRNFSFGTAKPPLYGTLNSQSRLGKCHAGTCVINLWWCQDRLLQLTHADQILQKSSKYEIVVCCFSHNIHNCS